METETVIILMGVSGSGKSTLGTTIAAEWIMPFFDGDKFQPPGNIQKMAAGIALQDDDRWPWLNALGTAVSARESGNGAIVACSALKRSYRDRCRQRSGSDDQRLPARSHYRRSDAMCVKYVSVMGTDALTNAMMEGRHVQRSATAYLRPLPAKAAVTPRPMNTPPVT
jgi:hypothetical protein